MNTYLIPVTESYGYNYDYIACVHANTPQEAYFTYCRKTKLNGEKNYISKYYSPTNHQQPKNFKRVINYEAYANN